MASSSNTLIDIPPFVLKLRSEFPDRETFGTGFIVDYEEHSWLFTCWHNVGPVRVGTEVDLTGELTASHISLVASCIRLDLAGRRIVGARLESEPVDVVAIELLPAEKPPPPWFEARREFAFEGFPYPREFSIQGRNGGEWVIVPIVRHFFWQGFPGRDAGAPPVAHLAFDFPGSTSRHPWMLRYTPAGLPGTSGCPVIEYINGNRARVAGIHVHHTSTGPSLLQFDGRSSVDGRAVVARASFEWGAAVPIELLYRAIDLASGAGVSVVPFTPAELDRL